MISIPFSGSKKYSYKYIKPYIETENYKTVYEPFGGSGVLSVNLLNDGLVSRAVVNDYDRFFDDYEEYLDLKDKVVDLGYKAGLKKTSHCSKYHAYYRDETNNIVPLKSRVLHGKDRETIQRIIAENVPEKFWRYFTLGNNFCFSTVAQHDVIRIKDFTMFSSYLKTDKQRAYLDVLKRCEIEHLDYLDFLNKYRDEFDKDCLIIADPPYVNTDQGQYKGKFDEQDTLRLIDELQKLPCDYIFFNRDLDRINKWFDGIDCEIKRTGMRRTKFFTHSAEEYLIYVHKAS